MRSRFLAPWAITIGPDGNLWFTNLAINGLGSDRDCSDGLLEYDPTTGLHPYVWTTNKAWTGQCRKFTPALSDGTSHEALFKFK
jgi:hypothetical protein